MKVKEILEKAKAISFEKGKCYLILIEESSSAAMYEDSIVESIEERFVDVYVMVGVVDDLNKIRIFELEK